MKWPFVPEHVTPTREELEHFEAQHTKNIEIDTGHESIDYLDHELSEVSDEILDLDHGEMQMFVSSYPEIFSFLESNDSTEIKKVLGMMENVADSVQLARLDGNVAGGFERLSDFFDDPVLETFPEPVRSELEILMCLMIPGFNDFMHEVEENTQKEILGQIIDLVPGIGVGKMTIDVLRSKEMVSGNTLDATEKGWNIAFIIVGLFGANALKWFFSGAKVGKNVMRISAALRKASKMRIPSRWLYRAGKLLTERPALLDQVVQTSIRLAEDRKKNRTDELKQKKKTVWDLRDGFADAA